MAAAVILAAVLAAPCVAGGVAILTDAGLLGVLAAYVAGGTVAMLGLAAVQVLRAPARRAAGP